MTGFGKRCLAVGPVGVILLSAATAWAQSISADTLELTIAAGGGASIPRSDVRLETVTNFQLLPHLGYFLTGEMGSGALAGNFEILVEPTLIHLDASNSATVGGAAILSRWVFAASPRVRPYLEAGAGILGGRINLPLRNCDVDFILEGGVGALFFTSERVALTAGARAPCVERRPASECGLNSVIGIVGISYFSREHGYQGRSLPLCGSWTVLDSPRRHRPGSTPPACRDRPEPADLWPRGAPMRFRPSTRLAAPQTLQIPDGGCTTGISRYQRPTAGGTSCQSGSPVDAGPAAAVGARGAVLDRDP